MNGSERRAGSRRRVLKKALIVFNDGHCSMGCQVLDGYGSITPAPRFLIVSEGVRTQASGR